MRWSESADMRSDPSLFIRRLASPVWLICASASLSGVAMAQTSRGNDPSTGHQSPSTLPTQLHYTSPIGGYQSFKDQPLLSWREANDRVGQIGGWKAYAREAQAEQAEKPSQGAHHPTPHTGHQGRGEP